MAKYNNKKVMLDGIEFDSVIESKRYSELRLLQLAGEISDLTLQPSYRIEINGALVCVYNADFEYRENNTLIAEDVKGMREPPSEYAIKAKLLIASRPDIRLAEYRKGKGRVFKKLQNGKLLNDKN